MAAIAKDESPACCDECCDIGAVVCAGCNCEAASKDEREGSRMLDMFDAWDVLDAFSLSWEMISLLCFEDGGEGRWFIGAEPMVSVNVDAMISV